MKVLTILGTRPEAIRLYHSVKLINSSLFWTGQNFSKNLSTDIIEDPRFNSVYKDMVLSSVEEFNFFKQFSKMLINIDNFIQKTRPDKILILGDTNSSLAAALAAKKNTVFKRN
jgi:UDP-N-acetylglucosamine 2-epimerase (non-hydrolysing)